MFPLLGYAEQHLRRVISYSAPCKQKDAAKTKTSTPPVGATVNYDEATKTVKLDPSKRLAASTRYTMKISEAKDLAGTALPDYTWSFKTGSR